LSVLGQAHEPRGEPFEGNWRTAGLLPAEAWFPLCTSVVVANVVAYRENVQNGKNGTNFRGILISEII